jgi:hypothetical protein
MPLSLSALPRTSPLAELRTWLRASAARYRGLRLHLAAVRTDVALDIAADCIAASNTISAAAHSAETHDREALALLDTILADGRITPAELPALRRARALTARSADMDHTIAEHATILSPATAP